MTKLLATRKARKEASDDKRNKDLFWKGFMTALCSVWALVSLATAHHNLPGVQCYPMVSTVEQRETTTSGTSAGNGTVKGDSSPPAMDTSNSISASPGSISTSPFRDFLEQAFQEHGDGEWGRDAWQSFLLDVLEYTYQEPLVPIDDTCIPPPLVDPETIDCGDPKYSKAQFEPVRRAIPAKIGHAIPLGFEVDTLEIMLHEMYQVVDKFFIIEWTDSHNPMYFPRKPLTWERIKNQPRFRKFQDKVVHFTLDDSDAQTVDLEAGIWAREYYQATKRWERIVQWNNQTNFFGPDDIIGFGDADEIPSRENVHLLKHCQMKQPRLDVGIWFPIADIHHTYCPTYIPIRGEKCSFGDPTFWKWPAAFDPSLYLVHIWSKKRKWFPDRMWGTSGPYLLGGIHLSQYGYLPFLLAKKLAATETENKGMVKMMQSLAIDLKNNTLQKYNKGLAGGIGKFQVSVHPNSYFDPKDLNGLQYLPWFYDCNRDRYPQWEGKPDGRLGDLDRKVVS